jgi:hypothetical protein
MSDDQPTCALCHEEYSLPFECEPTRYCNDCAHKVAEAAVDLASCLQHIKTLALECREDPKVVLIAVGLSACGGVGIAQDLNLLEPAP